MTQTDGGTPALRALWNRAGNLEKQLEAVAANAPLAPLTAEQIRAYNTILAEARQALPNSVVLRQDAPDILDTDAPRAQAFFRVMHLAVVPTLHNAIAIDTSAALPGV